MTYVLTVENTGGASAYDVTVKDAMPAGLSGCTVSSVKNGAGADLTYSGDLFGNTGLVIANSNPLAPNDGTLGAPYVADTALITLTCQTTSAVLPQSVLTSNASVTWSAFPSATPFPPVSDDATVTLAAPVMTKVVDKAPVTTGDIVTYTLQVTLPEGSTPGLTLTDVLPAGFQYVANSVVVTPGTYAGAFAASPPTASPTGSVTTGQTLTLSFGDTTTTADNDVNEQPFHPQLSGAGQERYSGERWQDCIAAQDQQRLARLDRKDRRERDRDGHDTVRGTEPRRRQDHDARYPRCG